MARTAAARSALPEWIRRQLTQLVSEAPDGDQWLHEIKYDGFRMHARLDHGEVRLLTRNGLNWTAKYPQIAGAVSSLHARQAYVDGELCGPPRRHHLVQHDPDGVRRRECRRPRVLSIRSSPSRRRGSQRAAADRPQGAARRLAGTSQLIAALQRSPDRTGPGFYEKACTLAVEGIVSKRADAAYLPGNRGLWLKIKCLNREEFVVIGWTDPEGARPFLGALLLGYYDPGGRLVYAGRVGTGINQAELARLWRRLQPLAIDKMPLDVAPPRSTRFGSPLVLSRVHWVRPELVAEVKFLTWTDDNLLRQVVYQGLREDKPAIEVRRPVPHRDNWKSGPASAHHRPDMPNPAARVCKC